jgi:hypothetical protein
MLGLSALTLGFVHGLGADHLMAIAALAVDTRADRRRGRVMQTAVGFAVGHTIVLGIGAALALAFGWVLPTAFESGAERVGGALLIGLGLFGAWGIFSGRAYGHLHQEIDGPTRWHFHFGRSSHHPHPHSSLPTLMGAVFAASSLRALMLLEPFGVSAAALAVPRLLVLLILFGFGILAAMSLFGVLLAGILSLRAVDTLGRVSASLVSVASILLGVYWMIF